MTAGLAASNVTLLHVIFITNSSARYFLDKSINRVVCKMSENSEKCEQLLKKISEAGTKELCHFFLSKKSNLTERTDSFPVEQLSLDVPNTRLQYMFCVNVDFTIFTHQFGRNV